MAHHEIDGPFMSLFQVEKEEAEEKTQIKVDLRESQDSGAGAGRRQENHTDTKFDRDHAMSGNAALIVRTKPKVVFVGAEVDGVL